MDILQLAKTVKSTFETKTLSKQLLQNVGKLGNMTTKVHSVTNIPRAIIDRITLNQTMGDPKVMIRMERNAVIVVIHILLNNIQCMGRNFSNVRKRIISPSFADVMVVPKDW